MPKKKNKETPVDPDTCVVCGIKIKTMAYKGTGVCSDNHRKVRDGNDPDVARH